MSHPSLPASGPISLRRLFAVLAGASALSVPAAGGAVLFTETFDTDHTSDWTVNSGGGTNSVDFFFDYSTVGIPSAPNSGGTTRGLKLQANLTGDLFTGVSVSPNGQSFEGDYALRFDLWMNYHGPLAAGGNGSTQITGAGIGTAGNVPVWQGAAVDESIFFAATGEGGSATDYRAYYPNPNAAAFSLAEDGSTIYAAAGPGNRNSSHTYYSSLGGQSAPQAQVDAFPDQTGVTPQGTLAFSWHDVIIAKTGNVITWTIDGTPYATLDLTNPAVGPTGGTNILFMQADINAASSTDVDAGSLLFGLIDNVRVVPEPASPLLLIGAATLLGGRRFRRTQVR